MARASWVRFFGRDGNWLLDRRLEALATGGSDDQHVGVRFARLVSVASPASPAAPAPADSAARASAPSWSPIVDSDTPAWAMPSAGDAEARIAPDPEVPALADGAGNDHDALPGNPGARGGTVVLEGAPRLQLGTAATNPFSIPSGREDGANYIVGYAEDFQSPFVMNATNKTLLQGGPGDWPDLGKGDHDVLILSGDFSTGFTLPSQPLGIDRVVVSGGDNYNLVSTDDQVAPGRTLTIDAMPLGTRNSILFDGSAETDGRFVFYGSDSADGFIGGAGNDRIAGLGGADMLAGGAGRDTFAYTGAGESTGANYDTLGDFDAAADRIDLPGAVSGFHAPVEGGTLSLATFDTDLSAALSGLGASQAAWFAPDAGDLAGQIFLIVDANGVAGYQEGEDYVFAVSGSPLADLSGHTDIFV